ncbi:hypothetical protein THAOC_22979, partial [Thalassiosira oceanica]
MIRRLIVGGSRTISTTLRAQDRSAPNPNNPNYKAQVIFEGNEVKTDLDLDHDEARELSCMKAIVDSRHANPPKPAEEEAGRANDEARPRGPAVPPRRRVGAPGGGVPPRVRPGREAEQHEGRPPP